jgi:hypothetical protein
VNATPHPGTTPDSPEEVDLVAQVRAVDGVTDIYSARPALAQIPGLIAAATGASGDSVADIVVAVKDGVPTVAARVATAIADSTPAAARRIAEVLLEQTPPQTRIAIQVARIQ